MAKILGCDIGDHWVGLAIADAEQRQAFPKGRMDGRSLNRLMATLGDLIAKEDVTAMVIGRPLSLQGTETEQTKKVDAVIKLFRQRFPQVVIETEDERLTTELAYRLLRAKGVGQEERKARKDEMAALVILQHYFDRQDV